jgi:hypothetical protein
MWGDWEVAFITVGAKRIIKTARSGISAICFVFNGKRG